MNVAVAGATGNQGGAVARRLLERGHHVRGLTRNPDGQPANRLREAGAQILAADAEVPGSLVPAVTGADAIFVMATPFEAGEEAETRQARNLIDAAVAAGVPHVVYSSVASADQGTRVPHFESKFAVEEHLRATGVPFTIVAPTAFMEMAIAPWALPALREGWTGEPLSPDVPVQRVALADIGAFAALVIDQPDRFARARIELAGDSLSGAEQAASLSRYAGHDLRYVQTPIERAGSEDLQKMFQFLASGGYKVDVARLRHDYPEIAWHDFEAWAAEQDWSILRHPVLAV
jgi:uncharacterized protein YbjT (DUF2867 family)